MFFSNSTHEQVPARWGFSALILALLTVQNTMATPVDPSTPTTRRAPFDAKTFFRYLDSSCDIDAVNRAGEDLLDLADAAVEIFDLGRDPNATQLQKGTFLTFMGSLFLNGGPKTPAMTLREGLGPDKKYLWCDETAFQWVTTKQEGPEKGDPLEGGGGALYILPGRRPRDLEDVYMFRGRNKLSLCTPDEGSGMSSLRGWAEMNGPAMGLCPEAFNLPAKSLAESKNKVYEDGTRLNSLDTPGSVLFHESTHAVLGLNMGLRETYGVDRCINLASDDPIKAIYNADNWKWLALAYLHKGNSWFDGTAARVQELGN